MRVRHCKINLLSMLYMHMPWSEFPIVSSYSHYPHNPSLFAQPRPYTRTLNPEA